MVWDSPRSSLTICSDVQDPRYSRLLRLHAGLTFVNSVSIQCCEPGWGGLGFSVYSTSDCFGFFISPRLTWPLWGDPLSFSLTQGHSFSPGGCQDDRGSKHARWGPFDQASLSGPLHLHRCQVLRLGHWAGDFMCRLQVSEPRGVCLSTRMRRSHLCLSLCFALGSQATLCFPLTPADFVILFERDLVLRDGTYLLRPIVW